MSATCVAVNLDLTVWVWVGVALDAIVWVVAYVLGKRRGRREAIARAAGG